MYFVTAAAVFFDAQRLLFCRACAKCMCVCMCIYTQRGPEEIAEEKKNPKIRVKRIPHNVTVLSYIIAYKLRFIIHYTRRVIAGPFERYEIGCRRGQTSQNDNLMAINTRILRIYGEFPFVGRAYTQHTTSYYSSGRSIVA